MFTELKKYFSFKNIVFRFCLVIFIYSLVAILNLLDFGATFQNNKIFFDALLSLLLTVGTAELFFLINYYFLKIKSINYLHLIITSFIIFLVIHPSQKLWIYPTVVLLGLIGKLIFRYKGKPIFNPAALGIFLFFILDALFKFKEDLFVSWWGANFGEKIQISTLTIYLIPLLFGAVFFYFAMKFRKHWYGIAFLFSVLLFEGIRFAIKLDELANLENILRIFSVALGTWIFMTFVMVVEPRTSPVLKRAQILLGLLGGLILVLVQEYAPGVLGSFEIVTILILNLLNVLLFSNANPQTSWIYKRTTKVTIKSN